MIITSENNQWVSQGSYISEEALSWTDWDAVSLQHYGLNTSTGMESIPYPDTNDEKFYLLKTASEYMLDHIARYAPYTDAYFYMHWAQTSSTVLNANSEKYNKMAAYLPTVLDYVGTESGKQFKAIISVGLSVQNTRSTYLALLRYNTTAYADGNLNLYTDAQIGLQRDGGHLSFNIGRYIAGLTFAEMIIPEDMRAAGYILPNIRITESVGELPWEYTEIAQKAVFAAVENCKNGSLSVTHIQGYNEDPISFSEKIDGTEFSVTYSQNDEELFEKIENAVLAALPKDFRIDSINFCTEKIYGGNVELEVKIRFGSVNINVALLYITGDVNSDALLDADDAIYLLRHVLLPTSYPIKQDGDVSGDGEVNTDDAIYLLRHVLMLSSYPLK